jgi:hypothetical protein
MMERDDFAVIHFSVQGNHLHLVVEARGAAALSRGVRALSIRIAKGLNRLMRKRGALFTDRYHARVLRSPFEARAALCYVLQNFRRHAAQRGERLPSGWLDPFSSATAFPGWSSPPHGSLTPSPVAAPTSWLLRTGWRRHGLVAADEVPGTTRDQRAARSGARSGRGRAATT